MTATPSHYPTSAELAAFRQPAMNVFSPYGAWPHEIAHGIGYRDTDPFLEGWVRDSANRMRSRQYALTYPLNDDPAFWDAVHTFAPSHDGPRYAKP